MATATATGKLLTLAWEYQIVSMYGSDDEIAARLSAEGAGGWEACGNVRNGMVMKRLVV